jgi:hypothetical protein
LVESIDNAQGRRLSLPISRDDDASASGFPSPEPDPVTVAIDRDWQQHFHRLALKELEGEPLLVQIFECLENDITDPSDIAVMLSTSVDDINNAKKRLRRKLDKLDPRHKPVKQKVVS